MAELTGTTMWPLIVRYSSGRMARGEIARNTAIRVRSILASFAISYGRRPVANLGRAHIEAWMAERGPVIGPASRRNEFQAMRQFTCWLRLEKVIKTDPCAGMRAPRVPRSVPRALTAEEVDQLRAVLPDQRARAMVALMLDMGLRRGEVIGLQVGDWDRTAKTLRVKGKGGHERVLPVPDIVTEQLSAYLNEVGARSGPMIRRLDGGPISNSYIGRMTREWLEESGVKARAYDGKACHALRHTLASEVADVEPDLRVLQQLLGHVSLTSTQVYLRGADMDRMRTALATRSLVELERARERGTLTGSP